MSRSATCSARRWTRFSVEPRSRKLVRLAEAAPRFGSREIPEELGLQLALQAARTLHQIAVNRSPVYDIAGAEAALVAALANPSEELRTAAASALAQINSAAAQSAIAAVALSPDQTETLRK
ncbi:MAG TPA: hypothetical protein PLB91_04955, partial [Spirochaetales bacterium]|nr:hypothetical protein [Spirochaetales bacterium]